MLPLNVHHNRKCTLCMTSLLLGNLVRTGNCKITSCPETDVVRHGLSRTGHKIRDTLDAGQLHIIAVLILLIILLSFCRCATCKKTVDHKLKKSILSRKLGSSAKRNLPDLVDCISFICILSGKADVDVVFPEPFDQACETGINLSDICRKNTVIFFKLKSCLFRRI